MTCPTRGLRKGGSSRAKEEGRPFKTVADSRREHASVPATPRTSVPSSSAAPSTEESRPERPPTKYRVMRAMRVGNLPLQGTREEVKMAMSRSLGLSMMRQPVTPQALHPMDIHMKTQLKGVFIRCLFHR